jgi:taurine dioxygenase
MTAGGLRVRPLGTRFGAEVLDAALSDDLSRGLVEDLRDALLEHRVLVFRRQSLPAGAHTRLLSHFGSVTRGAATAGIRNGPASARWVCERSVELSPPHVVSYRAEDPRATGRRIVLADAVGAYQDLPPLLRALADRSWAVHAEGGDVRRADDDGAAGRVAHPVVRLHPETGERGLMLGRHARRVIGLTGRESRTVLQLLHGYLVRPHNLLQWSWAAGDVLLLDSRAVHRREPRRDEIPAPPRMDVAGHPPLGVNGQHSYPFPGALAERRSA